VHRSFREPTWRRYLRFFRPSVDADIDDELRAHLETRVEELVARGSDPERARVQALEEFGDVDAVRADLTSIDRRILERRQRTERWDALRLELRHAARRLVTQPGFTVPAVLTLALGLAATISVFTLLDAVVLRALPYPESDRLVRIQSPVPGVGADVRWGLAKAEFLYFARDNTTFDALGLYRLSSATMTPRGGGSAERVRVSQVRGGVADVERAQPSIGRPLTADDNRPAEPGVALLADAFWRRQFGGDPAVIGSTVTLDGKPLRIVGVLPPDARMPEELSMPEIGRIDLWLPLWIDPSAPPTTQHTFRALGRMKREISIETASADLDRLTARLPEALPSAYSPAFLTRFGFSTEVIPLRDDVLGGIARILWILFGAVALVLAIACANVANLFLVRMEIRRRETAIRAALGAGRSELARHFFSETLLLTTVAGALALVLTVWAIRFLVALAPEGIPRLPEVRLDWSGVAFTALLSIGAGLTLGAIPLGRRTSLMLLGEAGRGNSSSRREHSARRALIVGQVALSLILLVGGALLVQSFRRLTRVDPGLDPDQVTTFRVLLPEARYGPANTVADFYRGLADRLTALPGVERVGASNSLPFTGDNGCSAVLIEGQVLRAGDRAPCVPIFLSAPGYFATLGVSIRGREVMWEDMGQGAGVAVVSESFAKRFWPGQDPIGKWIGASSATDRRRVVGVASDIRADGLDKPPLDAVFVSMFPVPTAVTGGPSRGMIFVVRSTPGIDIATGIRAAIAELDPQVPVIDLRSMNEIIARSMARISFSMLLLAVAAGMALVLSVIGIYGVISYIVARQRSEIGIRMALGARAAEVGRLVVLQTLRLATIGVLLGVGGALLGTRILRSLLFEVSPTDPWILGAVSVLLIALAAAASYGPARRAMRVAPIEALRHD
jgi:predicted permease